MFLPILAQRCEARRQYSLHVLHGLVKLLGSLLEIVCRVQYVLYATLNVIKQNDQGSRVKCTWPFSSP